MATANVQITIRGDNYEGNISRFEPGDVVSGSVQITPQEEIKCRGAAIRLQWHTEGRGTRDQHIVAQTPIAIERFEPNQQLSWQFSFTLPREPWSYAGHYITIVWEIVFNVDVPFGMDVSGSQPFILAPESHNRGLAPRR